jgi:hypothetical protein
MVTADVFGRIEVVILSMLFYIIGMHTPNWELSVVLWQSY